MIYLIALAAAPVYHAVSDGPGTAPAARAPHSKPVT
ncbi:MAG: hypothetical protein K0R39_3447 [Symbiobacteriaceae bacterium]|jgi:hypothetical protein|nr:hypothetical protein [Symbiobacteriaceae bacterium]